MFGITSAHTKVLCSPLVSRWARSGVFNLLKSEIAEMQPSMLVFCLLGLPQRSVSGSEDFGNEKNLRGHQNTWREGPIKCLKGHSIARRKSRAFYRSFTDATALVTDELHF